MQKAIWKVPIPLDAGQRPRVPMPAESTLRAVQVQRGVPCLWAEVDPDDPLVDREFFWAVTGERFDPAGMAFVGTVQTDGGIVLHLYDRGPVRR